MSLPMLDALAGRPTPRVPFWEVWFGMDALAQSLLGRPMVTPRDRCEVGKILGWDAIYAGGLDIGAPIAEYETASDGTTHYVQRGLQMLEGLHERPLPDRQPALEAARAAVAEAHAHGLAAVLYVPWAFHRINAAIGLEAMSFAVYDNRDLLHDAFEWVEQRVRIGLREVAIPAGVDFVLFDGDCAFKTGLMVRPNIFRELVFERTRETTAILREAGIPYTLHSDGKLDELIPMLIELGFSGVHGVEAQANDLGDIKARFGRDITLIGNMDVVQLTHSTVEQVRELTTAMLRTGSPGGRYIAAVNTSPLDYIPRENYLAFCETIREFRV